MRWSGIRNVVKTIGGSKNSQRRPRKDREHDLGRHRFLWTRNRIMSKSLRFPQENEWRRYRGLNNNIFLVVITFNHFRGGRPALPSDGLLHGGPVVTGKPAIRLAHSSSGLAHSLLPALCRRDTACQGSPGYGRRARLV